MASSFKLFDDGNSVIFSSSFPTVCPSSSAMARSYGFFLFLRAFSPILKAQASLYVKYQWLLVVLPFTVISLALMTALTAASLWRLLLRSLGIRRIIRVTFSVAFEWSPHLLHFRCRVFVQHAYVVFKYGNKQTAVLVRSALLCCPVFYSSYMNFHRIILLRLYISSLFHCCYCWCIHWYGGQ